MSGLAAVWRLDGRPLEPGELEGMLARLARRGPDGVGAWRQGPIGVGHRALHSTPESRAERWPLVDEAGPVVLAADVRLDNREELIAELGPAPWRTDPPGDGDLVLRAWQRWGEACPGRLLGDFALVVWDGRRQILFCARDPLGARPLYYHHGARLFACASEVKALLALPDVPRHVDERRVYSYFVPGTAAPEDTYFGAVRRLLPGHTLTVAVGRSEARRYWRPAIAGADVPRTDAACAEAFRELFLDVVRRHLRSAYPVGSALSGGLDSSSVTCAARALLAPTPLTTYSGRFPDIPGCDEAGYIEAVVAQGGIEPRYVRADTLDPLQALQDAPRRADETFHPPGYYMHDALYDAARQDGCRVFLEGLGGDTVVSHGTGYLHDLARQGRWLGLLRQARQLGAAHGRPTRKVLRRALVTLVSPRLRHAWRRRTLGNAGMPALLRPEVRRRLDVARVQPARLGPGPEARDGTRAYQWRQLNSAWLLDVREGLEAAASDAGLELRDPFFDRRLVEFCLALPASQKIRGGVTRVVLRHAMESLLPEAIRTRPGKAPLGLMIPQAIARHGATRLATLVRRVREPLAPFVDPDALSAIHRRYEAAGAPRDAGLLWGLLTLGIWLGRVQGAPAAPERDHPIPPEARAR